jgi:tRNA(Arg) A34 adenosine deaminase TadA
MYFDDELYIKEAIEFAKIKNQIWPFSSLIVDENGVILCRAVDCAHISPLFHSEALAIHALIMEKGQRQLGKLRLYTTAEPDVLSQSAIHWANVVHDLGIEYVCFGSKLATIQNIWPFGIDISAQEIIERSRSCIKLIGPVSEKETNQLFLFAKQYQDKLNKNHPAQGILSKKTSDFYELEKL